jgi:PKD repeat protein
METRLNHASVGLPDGSLLVIGGYHDVADIKGDIWLSSDNGVIWTRIVGNAEWQGRYGHGVDVASDGSLILTGGHGYGSSYAMNSLLANAYKNDSGNFTNITSDRRFNLNASYGNITTYAESESPSFEYKNDTWKSTDRGLTWTRLVENAPWADRAYHSHVVMPDGSIVIMGGADSYGYYNDTWKSTDNGRTWIRMTEHAGWTARVMASSVVMPDGSIILMGGNMPRGITTNDVWRSTDNGATWTMVNGDAPWSPRYGHTSVALPDGSILLMGGHTIYFSGGYFSGSEYLDDTWRSTDNGATWKQINTLSAWSPRFGHTSVVMPDGGVVLAGGADNKTLWNDIWRFQPASSFVQNPSHTYATPGTYSVSLTASNAGGSDTEIKEELVVVTAEPEVFTYAITNTMYLNKTRTVASIETINSITSRLGDVAHWRMVFSEEGPAVTPGHFEGIPEQPTSQSLNDATIHFHVGHGFPPDSDNNTALQLLRTKSSDGMNFDAYPFYASEVKNKWGGKNKWVVLQTCYTLRDKKWGQNMGTTHGIFGFSTVSNNKPALENTFLNNAIEGKSLYDSWYLATTLELKNDDVSSYYTPDGKPAKDPRYIDAVVFFKTQKQMSQDHLPGYGDVAEDGDPNDKNFFYDAWNVHTREVVTL